MSFLKDYRKDLLEWAEVRRTKSDKTAPLSNKNYFYVDSDHTISEFSIFGKFKEFRREVGDLSRSTVTQRLDYVPNNIGVSLRELVVVFQTDPRIGKLLKYDLHSKNMRELMLFWRDELHECCDIELTSTKVSRLVSSPSSKTKGTRVFVQEYRYLCQDSIEMVLMPEIARPDLF